MYRTMLALGAALALSLALRAADPPDGPTVSFARDGTAVLDNALVRVRVAQRPGPDYGLTQWLFKPTGGEMVDVLYGQTDYVKGHMLGEKFDPVQLGPISPGTPEVGTLYAPLAAGAAADGSGVVVEQESAGAYRLRRTLILRRDHALLEVRYELENLRAAPAAFAWRFHTACSPGARGRTQRPDDSIFVPTDKGILALDQTLNNDAYHQTYGGDKFFGSVWAQEPKRSWVSGPQPTPTLTGNWAAQVNRTHGDGMCLWVEPATLVGYYNCPGITLEPVLRASAPARGDVWRTTVYVGAFSGVIGKTIVGVTPLYVATRAVTAANGHVTGELVPLFAGKLRLRDGAGAVRFEADVMPVRPLALEAAGVAGAWSLEALDREGQRLGKVNAAGETELSAPVVPRRGAAAPWFWGSVHLPKETALALPGFLATDDLTVYCPFGATPAEKAQAQTIATRLGRGLAWTNPGGPLLVVGNVSDPLIRDIGRLKQSVSDEWPKPGEGVIHFFDNCEQTEQPLLLIAGRDAAGTVAAAEKFADEFLRERQAPTGFTLWATTPDRKVYPYTRPPAAPPPALRLVGARGEYEAAQAVITAYDEAKAPEVKVAPLVERATGKPLEARYVSGYRRARGPLWLRWVNYFPVDREGGWAGYPDPLLERPEASVPAGASQALWLTLIVPDNAPAGTYDSRLTVRVGEVEKSLPLEVEVWDFALPADGLKGEPYMSLANFPPASSRELSKVHVQYLVADLVEHGMRVLHPSLPDSFRWHFSPEGKYKGVDFPWLTVSADGCIALDSTRFDWLIETCDSTAKPVALQYMVYAAHVVGNAPQEFKQLAPKRYEGRPERPGHWYQSYYTEDLLVVFRQYLEKRGWLDRFVLKISDEPRGFASWFDDHTAAARAAKVPFTTCFNSIDWEEAKRGLGQLAVWQPLYMKYDAEFFARARAAGGKLSWYNCGPPPRLAIHATGGELRAYLWQAAKADLDSVAWWGIQCWGSEGSGTGTELWRNRYAHWNTVVYPTHPTKPPYQQPGRPGWVDQAPLDSIRWELIRDGMEDAWYVNLLRQKITAARLAGKTAAADAAQTVLDDIWATVFPTLNDYRPAYPVVLDCRRRVAAAILALGAPPK